ncbi:MAG: hypothetical protein HRT57_11780 [Crocinitomicaceae bacterium]|nr:hypothetical protein [Crocinitomicaceae bacterium]
MSQIKCIPIFSFLFSVCFSLSLSAQVNYSPSLKDAVVMATKQKKHLYIKYYSETCGHCIKLQEVLEIDSISKYINDNFISYKIDIEKILQSEVNFLSERSIFPTSTPSMLFFNPDLEFIHHAIPNTEASAVMKALSKTFLKGERTSDYKERFLNGEKDLNFLKSYSKLLKLTKDVEINKRVGDSIYEVYPKKNLLTTNSFAVTNTYIKSIDNGFFEFWMDNFSKIDSVAPNTTREKKTGILSRILIDDILYSIEKWDIIELNKASNYYNILNPEKNQHLFTWEYQINLLFKDDRSEDALSIAKSLYLSESDDVNFLLYLTKSCLNQASKLSELVVIEEEMKKFKGKITRPVKVGELSCYYMLLHKKKGEQAKFDRMKTRTENYLKGSNLNLDLFNEIVK